jgi:hypothetical protein
MTAKTYEMNWDCVYCGEQRLLGVTHRFCPSCGAAQNPEKRYFPPDDQKVAVQDHKFAGADLHCPACSQPQSAAVKCCSNCGSPMSGAQAAHRQTDQMMGPGGVPMGQVPMGQGVPAGRTPLGAQPAAPPAPKSGSKKWIFIVAGIVVTLIIAFIVVRFMWKEETAVEVTNHKWTRTIGIDRKDKFKESGNCSNKPSGAKQLSRTKGQKKCKTRKVDQGDGTFKEKKECKTEPDKCRWEVTKWKEVRNVKAKGDLDDKPKWPKVKLKRKGNCVGCERQGGRNESYTVFFKDTNSGDKEQCSFSGTAKWKSFEKGSKWKVDKYGLGGDLDCDSFKQ